MFLLERNYQKEYALAMSKVAELQEQVFAYQSMLDDAATKLKENEQSNNETQNTEQTKLMEVE